MMKRWLVGGMAILTSAALLVGQATMASAAGVGASSPDFTGTLANAPAAAPAARCALGGTFNSSVYNIYTPPAANPNVLTFPTSQSLYNIYTPPAPNPNILTFPGSQSQYNIYTPPAPNTSVLTFTSSQSLYNILAPC